MDIDQPFDQADYYSEGSEEEDVVSDAQSLGDAFENGDSDESEYVDAVDEGHDGAGEGTLEELDDLAGGLPADEEDSFERLLGSISQSSGDLYADGAFAQAHDASIATELASIRDDLAIAKGFGKRRRRGPRERRLPQKIQDLLGEGNAAYAMEDMPKAIAIMHEIIRIDATVYEAWVTLAHIQTEMGNATKALGLEMMAAHLKQDPDNWKKLAGTSRRAGQLDQALYCLRRTLAMRPDDTDALWDQALLFKDQGNYNKALESFQRLLALSPYDLNVLAELPPLLAATNNVNEGVRLYEAAFEHYTRRPYTSPDDAATTSGHVWTMDLLTNLADFMLLTYDFEGVISVVKRGQRWFQGRGRETHWDLISDDREYDPAGIERVTDAPQLGHGEGYDLDLNLRHRLAVARLKLAHDEDAMIHIDEILKTDAVQYTALWADIGTALIGRGFYHKALDVFGELGENPQIQEVDYVRSLAVCLQHEGKHDQAIEAFKFVCASEPDDLSMKLQLAEALETKGDKAEALKLVNEVLEARRMRGTQQDLHSEEDEEGAAVDDQGPSSGFFGIRDGGGKKSRTQNRMSKQDAEELQRREAAASFAVLQECDHFANLGNPSAVQQYKTVAGKLLSQFRTARALYPVDRSRKYVPFSTASKKADGLQQQDFDLQVVDMATRLQAAKHHDEHHDDGPTHMLLKQRTRFHGLAADEWLELCIKHCCLLMRLDENEEAAEILHHVSFSTIFDPPKYNATLNIALLAAYTRLHDYERMLDVMRVLIRTHQYSSDTYLLLSAVLGSGIKPADAFANLNLQKFLLREIKLWDSAASGDPRLRWNQRTGRWVLPNAVIGLNTQRVDEPPDDSTDEISSSAAAAVRPKKKSPVLYAIYGEVLLIAKSYQSAIHYLLQAFDVNPYDSLLCLLLAQAYIGRAMNRQSDNRHHQIVTGIAFMNRYKILRREADGTTVAEVDYNIARAYHGLGILHLALRHYLSSIRSSPVGGLSMFAAYNVGLILEATGGGASRTGNQQG